MTRGLSAVNQQDAKLLVVSCSSVYRRVFVPVNFFHAKHVREFAQQKTYQAPNAFSQFPDMPYLKYLSSPKPGHTTGGSRRGARRGGGAGSGRTGCQQNCSPRRQGTLVLSMASKTRRLNDSPEARTSEIPCKPNAGTKSAVDKRFISGAASALRSWLLNSGPTPLCLCKPCSCMACPGKLPGHALHEKGLRRQQKRRSTCQQPGRKSACCPGDKLRVNQFQNGNQLVILFSHSVYMGFRLFVLPESRSGDLSSMPWRVRGSLVSWATSSVGTQSCPTPPRRPAVHPDPTRPWTVRFRTRQAPETNRRLHSRKHLRTDSAFRTVYKPRINGGPNGDLVPQIGLHEALFVRPSIT